MIPKVRNRSRLRLNALTHDPDASERGRLTGEVRDLVGKITALERATKGAESDLSSASFSDDPFIKSVITGRSVDLSVTELKGFVTFLEGVLAESEEILESVALHAREAVPA